MTELDPNGASLLIQHFDQLTPEQQAKAREKLTVFRQSETFRLGLEQERQRETEVRGKLYESTEALVLDGDEAWEKSTGRKRGWQNDEEKKAFARASYYASQGADVSRLGRDGDGPVRLRLAQSWGLPDVATDDGVLDAEISRRLKAQRDERWLISGKPGDDEDAKMSRQASLLGSAFTAGVEGQSVANAMGHAALMADAGTPGWNLKHAPIYARRMNEAYLRGWQMRQEATADAKVIFEELKRETGRDESEPADMRRVLDLLHGKDDGDLALRWKLLGELAEKDPAAGKGFLEKVGGLLGRHAERLGRGGPDITARFALRMSQPVKAGDMLPAEQVNDPAAFVAAEVDQATQGMGPTGAIRLDGLFKEKVAITAEQATALNAAVAKEQEELQLNWKLRQIAAGTVDPVYSSKPWEDLGWKVADVGVSFATYLVPGGFAANAVSYVSEAEGQFIDAGATPEQAARMGLVSGMIQAGLDKLQLKALPGVTKALGKWAAPVLPAGLVARAAVVGGSVAGTAALETGIEIFQDHLANPATQELFKALGEEVGEVDWEKVKDEAWAAYPETFVIMLPLVLGGHGLEQHINSQQWGEVAKDKLLLRMAGFDAKVAEEISTAETPTEALREKWTQRDPKSEDAKAATAEFRARNAELLAQRKAELLAAQDPDKGVAQSVGRDAQGWYVVPRDGKEKMRVGTEEAALAMVDDLKQARSIEEARSWVELTEAFAQRSQPRAGAESRQEFSGEYELAELDPTSGTATRTAVNARDGQARNVENSAETARNLREELEEVAREAGVYRAQIFGSNAVETTVDGAVVFAKKLNAGGTIETLTHEEVETRVREGLKSGLLNAEDLQAAALQGAFALQQNEAGLRRTAEREAAAAQKALDWLRKDEEAAQKIDVNDTEKKAAAEKQLQASRRTAGNAQERADAAAGTLALLDTLRMARDGKGTEATLREAVVRLISMDLFGLDRTGAKLPAGILRRGLDAAIRNNVDAAEKSALVRFRQFLNAVRAKFLALFKVAAALAAARKRGELDADYERVLNAVVGLENRVEEQRHSEAVVAEAFSLGTQKTPNNVSIAGGSTVGSSIGLAAFSSSFQSAPDFSGDKSDFSGLGLTNPGKTGSQGESYSMAALSETDRKFLELAKDPEGNREALQRMVDAAAERAGADTNENKGFWHTGSDAPNLKTWGGSDENTQSDGLYLAREESDSNGVYDGATRRFFITWDNPFKGDVADFYRNNEKHALEALNQKADANFESAKQARRELSNDAIESLLEEERDQPEGINARTLIGLDGDGFSTKWARYDLESSGYDGQDDGWQVIVFNPNQIKSADPVTYYPKGHPKEGEPIPLSQRFNPESESLSFSLGGTTANLPGLQRAELDAQYLELAKDPEGNREALQRMVDAAAERAGPHESGFHGTVGIWDSSRQKVPAFYSKAVEVAKTYAAGGRSVGQKDTGEGRVIHLYLFGKLLDLSTLAPSTYAFSNGLPAHEVHAILREAGVSVEKLEDWGILSEPSPVRLSHVKLLDPNWSEGFDNQELVSELVELGYSGAIVVEDGVPGWVMFNPNQIKSADPVTYDAAGNIIPLSQRFDTTQESISFSLGGTTANLPGLQRAGLETARAMAAAGKDAATIRALTGWFPGKYDGKLRWEIPDEGAGWKSINDLERKDSASGFYVEAKLGEILDHPALFSAYPEIANLEILLFKGGKPSEKGLEGSRGAYRSFNGKNWIELYNAIHTPVYVPEANTVGPYAISEEERAKINEQETQAGTYAPNDALSPLLHEIQHWIQEKEGFARGANPDEFIIDADIQRLRAANNFWADKFKRGDRSPEVEKNLLEIQEAIKNHGNPVDAYRRTAGEIEARDVVARMNFTAEQRAAIEPYSSENIAKEDAIVMFDQGGTSFSLSPVRNLDAVAEQLGKQLDYSVEGNRKYLERASEKLEKMRRSWEMMPLPSASSEKDLDKEQRRIYKAKQAEFQAFYEAAVLAEFGDVVGNEDLAKFSAHPLFDLLRRSDPAGKKGLYKGRLMSPRKAEALDAAAEAASGVRRNVGDYDGADGVTRMVFGGQEKPDTIAQEAYNNGLIKDPSVDALWDGIKSAQREVANNKERQARAEKALSEARQKSREDARKEAAEWRDLQLELIDRTQNPRAHAARNVALLDAVVLALPPEVRAKIRFGGADFAEKLTPERFAQKIKERIRMVDKALTKHWRQKNEEELTKLLQYTGDKREPGEKPRGKLGGEAHRYFDMVAQAVKMKPEEVEERRRTFREKQDGDPDKGQTMDAAEEAEVAEKIQILTTWGAFDHKHVTEQAKALEHGWKVAREKRNERYHKELARLLGQRVLAQKAVETIGFGDRAKLNKVDQALGTFLGNLSVDIADVEGMLVNLLGREHELTQRWTMAITKADNEKTMVLSRARKRFDAVMKQAFPGLNRVQRQKQLHEMSHKGTVAVDIYEVFPDLTLTREQREAAEAAGESTKIRTQTKYPQTHAMMLTMMYKQAQYRESMSRAEWKPEVMADIERQLTPQTKMVRDHLWEEYRQGYFPLAELYEDMFGTNLPQIEWYSPARHFHQGKEKPMDSFGTGALSGGGFQDGFLNSRKPHEASVDIRDAVNLYWAHLNQTQHWLHFAPIVREMRAVFQNPQVKRSVKGAWGENGSGMIETRMQVIEGNGIAGDAATTDEVVNFFSSMFAAGKLAWNLGTAVKNVSSAFYPGMAGFEFKEWQQGLGELLLNPAIARKIFESDMMQARLEGGASPEQRAVMASYTSGKPGYIKEALVKGMELHSHVDTFSLTLGAAAAYNVYYKRAVDANPNLTHEQAEQTAMDQTAVLVSRVAQPVTPSRKSMISLKMNAFGKLMWIFSSDAAQKTALTLQAWRQVFRGKAGKHEMRVLLYSHLVLGTIWTTLNSIVKDMRDGDDDDDDDPAWEWENYALGIVMGPLGGYPLLGELFGWIGDKLSGKRAYTPGGTNVMAEFGMNLYHGTSAIKNILVELFDDDEADPEKMEKDVLKVINAIGAPGQVGGRIYKDAKTALDAAGVIDKDEETNSK